MSRILPVLLCAALLPSLAFAGDPEGLFRRRVTTSDGVPLALYRYVPPGGGLQHPPVLLIPDLGLGRSAFDLGGSGLAPWLRERGRDVFVVELRGQGASGVPLDWSLEEILRRDLPAALAAVRQVRSGPVDLVVHGYSGTLLLAAAATEARADIGRIVALSTPAQAAVPNRYAEAILERGGRLSSYGLDPQGAAVLELLFARHGKIPKKRLRRLLGTGFFDLGGRAAAELLGWMRTGDLTLSDGSTVRGRLAALDRPVLQILALRNNWVHPEDASTLREFAPRAKVSVRLLSLLQFHQEDYTHLSLLHGEGARRDVFPMIEAFLEAAPAALAPAVAAESAR